MKRRSMPVLTCFRTSAVALAATFFLSTTAFAADHVNVRFSWKLKGEYAHFFLAQDQGLYEENGVEPSFGEGAGSQAALGALIQGQEDLVVMPAIFAMSAILKGIPVKLIAIYHPKAPVAFISHPDTPVTTPKDMEGKTIAASVGETGTAYLDTFCALNAIDCGKIKLIQMDSQARVPQFLQNQVDMVSVYRTSDLPVVEDRTGTTYPTIDLGLNLPGLAVVSSEAAIENKPDVLRRFLAATDEAIQESRENPKAAAEALAKVWTVGPSIAVMENQVEATMAAIVPPAGRPDGWIDEAMITDALDLLATTETVDPSKPATDFYTNALLSE